MLICLFFLNVLLFLCLKKSIFAGKNRNKWQDRKRWRPKCRPSKMLVSTIRTSISTLSPWDMSILTRVIEGVVGNLTATLVGVDATEIMPEAEAHLRQ